MRRRFLKTQTPRVRVRKLCDSESEEEKIAVSRVRVFPSMPSVGTRRSTRVFVPKSVAKAGDADVAAPVRVLRSGKRLEDVVVAGKPPDNGDSEDEWLRWLRQEGGFEAVDGDGRDELAMQCDRVESDCRDIDIPAASVMESATDLNGRMFGIVYSRKRRRSTVEVVGSEFISMGSRDRMYGIPFVRKHRRKRSQAAGEDLEILQECQHVENYRCPFRTKRTVIVVSVECLWSSSQRFGLFLVSVLGWMKQSRLRMPEFAHFLMSNPIAGTFALCGIHFGSVDNQSSENHLSCRSSGGVCMIFGARQFIPLVSLNFAALPFYFMSLHLNSILQSHYLPDSLVRFLMNLLQSARGSNILLKKHDSYIPSELDHCERSKTVPSGSPIVKRDALDISGRLTDVATRNVAFCNDLEIRKHQKRRTSLRSARILKHPLDLQNDNLVSGPNGARKINLASYGLPLREGVSGPGRGKSLEMCSSDFFSVRDGYAVVSSPRTKQGQKKLRNIPSDKFKELKSTLLDLKQNIDSARCSANILVIESDRCWRENGAEVMLEFSGSREYLLAVKTQGLTRYLHKAQEMRPSTFNRYTHAMMWTGENGWKLEFCDRKDWFIFKELHRECCEKNTQAVSIRIIPVPGVRVVSDYGDGDGIPFTRPDAYISMGSNEVERALMSRHAKYDMDSEDEEWLKQLNAKFHESDNGDNSYISEDSFERIIFSLEKDAYTHSDDVSDVNRAVNHCLDVGRSDLVASVYDYWLRKRKQKRSLVRVFQGQPPKKAELIQKPSFRKRRSFKRQASQCIRGKPASFLQAAAKQDAIQRVQEAQRAATTAVESAVLKRRKAQMLMQASELATYKAVMALRLAEAALAAESTGTAESTGSDLLILD